MKKLTLKHPLKFGEKTTITELNFRDYTTAADYLSFDRKGGVNQRIALIASLTGTDEIVIMQLRGTDYRRAETMADDMLKEDEAESDDGGGNALALIPEQEAALKK
jgi:hypothetical protein